MALTTVYDFGCLVISSLDWMEMCLNRANSMIDFSQALLITFYLPYTLYLFFCFVLFH